MSEMRNSAHGLTASQVDKLGLRLQIGTPSDDDLSRLSRHQVEILPVLVDAMDVVRDAHHRALPSHVFEPTMRIKQLRSIIDKLEREHTRLSTVQDLVGFRIVVPRIVDQQNVIQLIPSEPPGWRHVDRRSAPSYGYRAVHIVRRHGYRSVEVQIRTMLQHQWAELSERMDRVHPGTKYGLGNPEYHAVLTRLSENIARFEQADLASLTIIDLDQMHSKLLSTVQEMIDSILDETGT